MLERLSAVTSAKLHALLEQAIGFDLADKGTMQLYNPERDLLELVAQRGFRQEFIDTFKEVRPFDPCACGRALGIKGTVIIEDILQDMACRPFVALVKAENFRSVKSVSLFDEQGTIVGVISTHFRLPQFLQRTKGEIPKIHLQKIAHELRSLSPVGDVIS